MLKNINFNHLFYFYVIAKERSLAQATKVLKVSQPTLSQQLKQFEDNIEIRLFNREGRSLKLNQHGKYLFNHCKRIFNDVESLMSGFNYQSQLDSDKTITIGITSSISKGYASKLLGPLFKDETSIIKIIDGDIDFLTRKMKSFKVDFILSESPRDEINLKGTRSITIKKTQNIVICGNNFQHEIKNIPEDLNNCPYFKYSSNNTVQQEIDKYFLKNNIKPKVVVISDDIGLMLEATEVNHCFSIVPQFAADDLIEDKKIVKLGEIEPTIEVHGIYIENDKVEDIAKVISKIKNQFD
jgi:LysR family transcriptional activator of nhaA